MKKLFLSLIILAIVAVGGFGAYWYIATSEMKASVEQHLADIQAGISDSDAKLTYTSVEQAGFPNELVVSIKGLAVNANKGDNKLNVLTTGDLVLGSDLLASNFFTSLPNSIDVSISEEGNEESYSVSYNTNPVINIATKEFAVWDMLKDKNKYSFEDVLTNVKSIEYNDTGSKLINKLTGSTIYTQDASRIFFDNNVTAERINVSFFLEALNSEYKIPEGEEQGKIADIMFKGMDKLGKSSVKVDLSADLPENTSNMMTATGYIDVRAFDFISEFFSFKINGRIDKDDKDIAPYGSFTVSLNNYEAMVDYYAELINEQQEAFREANPDDTTDISISDEAIISVKETLRKLADDPNADSSDITITIKRDQGTSPMDLTVGTLNAQQLMALSGEVRGKVMPTESIN